MNIRKKYGFVRILGGFGNQLFQLCFANYLKENDFEVVINKKILDKVFNEKNPVITRRPLILPLSYFGFNSTNVYQDTLLNIEKLPLAKNLITTFTENNIDLSRATKYNVFNGYWQYGKFLHGNKTFLRKSLSNNKQLKEGIESKLSDGSVALHVRRSDYLLINQNLYNSFYEQALLTMQKKVNNFNYSVFTDDLDWVKNNKLFNDANKIHSSENLLDDFYNMLLNQHFVVGNSTFSLMAAFIKEEADTKVIVANPWFRGEENRNFIKDNWIKIPNE
jgi:hypothetical protein